MSIRSKTSEENFRRDNNILGDKFINDIIVRAKNYQEFEEVLFWLGGAYDNLQTFNQDDIVNRGGDLDVIRDSMDSAMDDASNIFTYAK